MTRKTIALLLALSLLMALLPTASAAGQTVVYDASQFTQLRRSRQDIADRYNAAIRRGGVYDDNDESTWYARVPSLQNPYDEGMVSQAAIDAMTAMTDFWRWMIGVEPLRRTASGTAALQRGALIRNWDFNHTVSDAYKPADMTQQYWDSGKVSHNILALRYTPQEAIFGWCNEGYNTNTGAWDTVGHRFCLLSADISEITFGYSGDVAIGLMTGHANKANLPFTAYPAPGLEPTELITADETAWSVEPDASKLRVTDPNALRVTVTDNSGNAYTCTKANGKLTYGTWSNDINFVQPTPGGKSYADGSVFDVVITGLQDAATGNDAELRYQVEFFSMLEYMDTTVSSCAPAGWNTLYVPESMSDAASLEMLAALLPDTVFAATANGRRFELPITGGWTLDQESGCWTAAADASPLPKTVTDPKGILKRVTIRCEIEEYTGRLMLGGGTPTLGAPGTVTVKRYLIGTPSVSLYQLRVGSGDWTAELRYNQASSNCTDDNYDAAFSIDAWNAGDRGVWVGLYASSFGGWIAGSTVIDFGCTHETTVTRSSEPTCTEAGASDVFCAACAKQLSHTVIPARGHDWMEPEYVWYDDWTRAAASRTCRNDPSHVETEMVYTQSVIVKRPTEEEEGERVYTATFTNPAFAAQTHSIILSKLPCDGGRGCPGRVFTDMPKKGNWAHDAIDWAIVNEITAGTTATTFSPGSQCTRGQVVTFLWRAVGSPEPKTTNSPFTDVKQSAFYYRAMLWAVENGVTTGTGTTTFTPAGDCTRAQVVTFLYRTDAV